MDVQTGADKHIFIDGKITNKICKNLSKYNYETGGVLGSTNNTIVEFEFDKYSSHELYEYYPTTTFLEKIINEVWKRKNVSFIGIVHSHLHNNEISHQDIAYCREIIKANDSLEELIMGILDLSDEHNSIRWYSVSSFSVEEKNGLLTL